MKKVFMIICLALCASLVLLWATRAQRNELLTKTITVNSIQRTYYLHISANLPKDKAAPLVMVFHGGGGEGVSTSRLTKFNAVADRENFIAVYPNGVGNNWNDGRETDVIQAQKEKVDDIAFVNAMLDAIAKEYKIDAKRVYATGISNGGIFSHYIGANLSNRIAAIAPVVGGIADPFYKNFKPEKPVSVLIFQGTADPLVPYNGGYVARNRGKIIATDEAVKLWLKNNGINEKPTATESFDKDKDDGCTVDKYIWSGGKNRTEVVLYKLNGGGHAWAGSSPRAFRLIESNVCRDVDATEIIWEFFKGHPKP